MQSKAFAACAISLKVKAAEMLRGNLSMISTFSSSPYSPNMNSKSLTVVNLSSRDIYNLRFSSLDGRLSALWVVEEDDDSLSDVPVFGAEVLAVVGGVFLSLLLLLLLEKRRFFERALLLPRLGERE